MKNEQVSRLVDEMLASTPPAEISDGHLLSSMEKEKHKQRRARGSNFGSVLHTHATRNDAGKVARPPDKRSRPEPEVLEKKIWRDGGGTVLL